MKSFRLGFVLSIAYLAVGCVVMTPESYDETFRTRRPVAKEVVESLRVGSTRKEEVLLRLGEPDVAWKGERVFAYRWIMGRGAIVASPSAAQAIPKTYLLLIEFDEDNLITRYEVKERLFFRLSSEEISEW